MGLKGEMGVPGGREKRERWELREREMGGEGGRDIYIERDGEDRQTTYHEPDLFAEQLTFWPCRLEVAWHEHTHTGKHHPRQNHQTTCKQKIENNCDIPKLAVKVK